MLVPAISSFESWLFCHYDKLYDQSKIIQKECLDQFIKNYSHSVAEAEKGFKLLTLTHLQHAVHPKTGNHSLRKFFKDLGILSKIEESRT